MDSLISLVVSLGYPCDIPMTPHEKGLDPEPVIEKPMESLEKNNRVFGVSPSSPEERRDAVCVVAELHLGCLLSDRPAFETCVNQVCHYLEENSVRVRHLVLLGETVDKSAALPGQASYGLSSDWQVDLAARIVHDFAQRINVEHVSIVGAKGKLRRGLSQESRLTDKLLLMGIRATYSAIEFELELGGQRIAFTQALGRTSGAYAGVVTPSILTENLMKANRLGAEMIVVGNYRKFAHSGGILSLPGYLLDATSEIFNERGLALLVEDKTNVELKMFNADPTRDPEALAADNLSYISGMLGQIYPYSFKGGEVNARQCSPPSATTAVHSCSRRGSYTQVHSQLPFGLASELDVAFKVLGFTNMTEWIREMARRTIREASPHIGTCDRASYQL